jgi:hypothetical protein
MPDDRSTSVGLSESTLGTPSWCDPFPLCQLRSGCPDKLHQIVEDILWIGKNYAIYRSPKGVFVHFSDNPDEETRQRSLFTAICPDLCELRYFTAQIRSSWNFPFGNRDRITLYEHNIAQAIMLVMEGRVEEGREIARWALGKVVSRVTNDNTIRYVCSCLIAWFACAVLGVILLWLFRDKAGLYIVAGVSGATGAILSVATRLRAFRLQPCNISSMNYLMSWIRIGIGVLAGLILFLFAPATMSDAMSKLIVHGAPTDALEWQTAAAIGLVAGFAERLLPTIMQLTAGQTEHSARTASEAVRAHENEGTTAT